MHKEAEEIEGRAKDAGESVSKCFSKTSKDLQEKWSKFSSSPRCWVPVLSAINVAVLGALGFVGYQNRSKIETADKRVLGAAAVGIATLLGGEGYVLVLFLFVANQLPCRYRCQEAEQQVIVDSPLCDAIYFLIVDKPARAEIESGRRVDGSFWFSPSEWRLTTRQTGAGITSPPPCSSHGGKFRISVCECVALLTSASWCCGYCRSVEPV